MAKPKSRTYSRYTRQAVTLLGRLIRTQRLEQRIQVQELAERAGISRDLLYRIEKGDPRVELGVAFEVAALVGVPLFAPDLAGVQEHNHRVAEKLALLPQSVRKSREVADDDF